jgi:hypothetical protein
MIARLYVVLVLVLEGFGVVRRTCLREVHLASFQTAEPYQPFEDEYDYDQRLREPKSQAQPLTDRKEGNDWGNSI